MNQLSRILPYVRPYRGGLAAGMLFLLVSNAAGVLAPWLLGRAIDTLSEPDVTIGKTSLLAVLIVVAAIVSGGARFGMRQLLNGVSRRIENDLRDAFFEHLLRLDAAFYAHQRTGDLMSRATNDTQAVRMAIGPGVMYLVNTVAMTAFALAIMLSYSVRLTLVSLVPLALLPPVMLYFGGAIHRRFERIQEQFGTLSTMVQENLSGVRIVRAYTQEAAQEREFEELNEDYLEKNMALARISAVFRPLLTILTGGGILVVLWFGGLEVMRGAMSAGQFVAFFFYLGLLTWPMIALGWVISLFQRGAASMGRIQRIMDTEPKVREPAQPMRLTRVSGDVEFRNVSFRYPGTDRDVLHDLSLRIPAGRTAALVGPTGSGKSTIVSLLARRHDPVAGEILLDGVPLNRVPLDQLRRAIAIVPQDAFVFSETIFDNIALGLAPGTKPNGRVENASRVARLTETIALFPSGFQTLLGERGVNLSGGQRQRTTLARAIARDPAILVLDDALSAVDTHTETEILRGLRDVLRQRTALVISHRVTAVMNADVIFVLAAGRIEEQGTHHELMRRGGLYATLLQRQILSDELDDETSALAASKDPV
jgi:ATP-binding cassette subfamily B multidrug efflux pump